MADKTVILRATCLCGAAKHEMELPAAVLPLKQSLCHCDSCRHTTGTLCLTGIELPESYRPSQELLQRLTPYPFSSRLTYYFCATCGSHLIAHCYKDAHDHSKGAQYDATTGSLEKADGVFRISEHMFLADTLDGGFADFLPVLKGDHIPRWAGLPGKTEELPLYWQSNERQSSEAAPLDRLHAHCKCGGAEFWIARPSERSKQASCSWPDMLVPYNSEEPVSEPGSWWLRDKGTKFFAGVCACNSCRLDTGMEWVEWAFVPTIDISLDAEGEVPFSLPFGTLKAYHSSEHVVRYHCSVCGASVFFTSDERDGLVDVAVGLMHAEEGARASSWLDFCTKRLSFREDAVVRAKHLTLAVEDGLQRFGSRQGTLEE